jgi:hypothetical protein
MNAARRRVPRWPGFSPVGVGLDRERRYRADDRRSRDAALTLAREVVHGLAATRGVPDVNRVLQIEMS